jgi:hypothetical protein
LDSGGGLFRVLVHRTTGHTFDCATETRQLSVDLYKGGKDLRVIMAIAGHHDIVADHLIARQRVIIFDDNKRYFASQPSNGILVSRYDGHHIGHNDYEMFRLAAFAFVQWLALPGWSVDHLRLSPTSEWPFPPKRWLFQAFALITTLLVIDRYLLS